MKFSFTTMTTPCYTIDQIVKTAKLYRYDGVDIRVSQNGGQLTVESGKEEIRRVGERFQSEGIEIPSLLCYFEKYKTSTKDTSEYEDWLKRHLEIGEIVGTRTIRLLAHSKETCKDRIMYREICSEALHKVLAGKKTNMRVLIQNHRYCSTAAEALYIVKKVNLPNVKMVYSHDHCLITGENVEPIFNEIISQTEQLYIADVALRDQTLTPILPGEGVLPVHRLYKAYQQHCPEGYVTFKWYNIYQPELVKADVALPYFMEYIKKISSQ